MGKLKKIVLEPKERKPRKPKAPKNVELQEISVMDAKKARKEMVDILEACNISELVDLCLISGVRATHILSKDELIQLYLGEKKEPFSISRIGVMRDQINDYLNHAQHLIRTTPECPGNCWRHPDILVVCCFARLGTAVSTIAAVNKMTKSSEAAWKKMGKDRGGPHDRVAKPF